MHVCDCYMESLSWSSTCDHALNEQWVLGTCYNWDGSECIICVSDSLSLLSFLPLTLLVGWPGSLVAP